MGLPISTGFIKDVRDGMQEVTGLAMRYLGGTSSEDIEWVLSTLETFCTDVTFTEHMLPALMAGLSNQQNLQSHIESRLGMFKGQARSETTRIKRLIFEGLAKYDRKKAVALYRNLVSELKAYFGEASFSVMTTNYDLTFETAIEEDSANWSIFGIGDFEYGFSNLFGRPVYDSDKDIEWRQDILVYLKAGLRGLPLKADN